MDTSTMITLPQVAKSVGISRQAVFQAVKENRLEATEIPLGNRSIFLVERKEVTRFKRARARALKEKAKAKAS
jgi:predicted DNA-binding transcriptional regulator AlpA